MLVDADKDTYSPSDFPGSLRWRTHRQAEKVLSAFDGFHPEIVAEITGQRRALRDAKMRDLTADQILSM